MDVWRRCATFTDRPWRRDRFQGYRGTWFGEFGNHVTSLLRFIKVSPYIRVDMACTLMASSIDRGAETNRCASWFNVVNLSQRSCGEQRKENAF